MEKSTERKSKPIAVVSPKRADFAEMRIGGSSIVIRSMFPLPSGDSFDKSPSPQSPSAIGVLEFPNADFSVRSVELDVEGESRYGCYEPLRQRLTFSRSIPFEFRSLRAEKSASAGLRRCSLRPDLLVGLPDPEIAIFESPHRKPSPPTRPLSRLAALRCRLVEFLRFRDPAPPKTEFQRCSASRLPIRGVSAAASEDSFYSIFNDYPFTGQQQPNEHNNGMAQPAGGAPAQADQNFDYMFKLLIIGNSSVGKTSFLFRYCDDSFTSAFVSTVGIDFKVKTVFRGDKRVKLQIWDTAGQERYRTITTAYYRGAMGFILMYDITNEDSFNSVQDWCTQIKTYSWENAQVVLVGNKCDMEDDRVVSHERGRQLADQLGLEFFEASAKENINVKAVFEKLVDIICNKMAESLDKSNPATAQPQGHKLEANNAPQQKSGQPCNC